jgi:hypothetical protein
MAGGCQDTSIITLTNVLGVWYAPHICPVLLAEPGRVVMGVGWGVPTSLNPQS